jgi:hypothetical protein
LGILEPLSRASAQALVKRINVALKPPLVVPGLES